MKKRRKYINKQIDIRRNRSVNKKYYPIIIAMIAIIILAIIFIKLGLEAQKNTKAIYQYKIEKKSDYEVLLKENDFYETKTLPAHLYYASRSIDTFNINFEYNFKGSNKTDIGYDYSITADLVGTVKDEYQDKEIWNRSFCILENKSDKQIKKDAFSINEKININYEEYNDLVNSYEREYGIKIDAVLKVRFNIAYKTDLSNYNDYDENTEKTEDFIELEIPITNTITEVKKNYENESEINIIPPIEEIEIKQYIYYTIAGLLIITDLIIFIMKIYKNKMTKEEKYEKNINHILKYYKDIIVTVKDKPNLTDLKIMEVITLDDLIDVAEQNNCNIIHYEDLANRINYLYVIVGEYVYYYKIVIN